MIAVVVALATLSQSHAHIVWSFPQPREQNSGIKDPYPCGTHGFFVAGDPVTTLKPGRQVLEITETVTHRGAPMRIALSKNNDDGFDNLVLLSHIPHADNAGPAPYALTFVIDIPDIDCPKCALQAISIMTDKIAAGSCCRYPSGGVACNSVYHTCANIRINGTRTSLPASNNTLPNIWTQEGNIWTKNGTQNVYMFDRPYTSFATNQCSCTATSCTVNTAIIGPTILPIQFPGSAAATTRTSTTRTSTTTMASLTTAATTTTTTAPLVTTAATASANSNANTTTSVLPTPMTPLRPTFADICFEYGFGCDNSTDFCAYKGKYMACATRSDRCGDFKSLSALFDSKCPAIKCQCSSVINSCPADGSQVAVQCTSPGTADSCAQCADCECERRCCTSKCITNSMAVGFVECEANNDLTAADCRCGGNASGTMLAFFTPAPKTMRSVVCAANQLRNRAAMQCGVDTSDCDATGVQHACVASIYAGCEEFLAHDKCNGARPIAASCLAVCSSSEQLAVPAALLVSTVIGWLLE
jgi:hypothetical protein